MQNKKEKAEQSAAQMSDEKRQKKLKNRKKLKYGGLATAVTVIFVAVVVLVNVVVSQIGKRFPDVVLDLTTANVYEISDETMDYIRDLDQDVEIAVSAEESTFQTDKYNKMIAETLAKYQGYSDHISVTYFDTTKDPDVLSKYQEMYGGTISANKIIVNSGERVKVYDAFSDMFDIDQETYQYYQYGYASLTDCITGFKGEQTLTTAIMNVTDSNPKTVGVITKANGATIFAQTQSQSDPNTYALAAAEQLLGNNGYDIQELDIVTDELDTETLDILLLPAPSSDLTTDAIKKMTDFLHNDGNLGKQLIYVADYTQASTPNLNAFLKEWNVQIDSSYVNDENSSSNQAATILLGRGQAYAFPRATVTEEEDYNGNLANAALPIIAPMARPIDALTANNGRTVTALLTTSDTSYRYPLTQSDSSDASDTLEDTTEAAEDATEAETAETTTATSFDTSTAEQQANTVMALCRDQQSTGDAFIESDVIVLGSMSMLDYNLIQDSSYNNAEYFVGLLNSICGKEDNIVIAAKDMTQATISATETQLKTIRVVVVFLIPLAVVAVGVVVAIRRRYR